MSNYNLTTPGTRGCGGSRKEGGLYLSQGFSPFGRPVWAFLFDPVVPHVGNEWQGIKIDEETSRAWSGKLGQRVVVLLDMVSKHDYPSVPAFVEEVARMGVSRRVPTTFNFDALKGAAVFLVTVHWKAKLTFNTGDESSSLVLPDVPYWPCKHLHDSIVPVQERDPWEEGYQNGHYKDCTYHLWPHAPCLHDMGEWEEKVGWPIDTRYVIDHRSMWRQADTLDLIERFPLPEFAPGRFAAWPITHLEAVKYVPDEALCDELETMGKLGGLQVVVMGE